MSDKLNMFNSLLNKKVIEIGTIISIEDLMHDFRILRIFRDKKTLNIYLRVKNLDTGVESVICQDKVSYVDSMPIARLYEAYSVEEELDIITIEEQTDIATSLEFCEKYKDGQKIIITNDKTPTNNKMYTVRKSGSSIRLTGSPGRPKSVKNI
jgi:hypothetical protein